MLLVGEMTVAVDLDGLPYWWRVIILAWDSKNLRRVGIVR
jgi:hypothetical protein